MIINGTKLCLCNFPEGNAKCIFTEILRFGKNPWQWTCKTSNGNVYLVRPSCLQNLVIGRGLCLEFEFQYKDRWTFADLFNYFKSKYNQAKPEERAALTGNKPIKLLYPQESNGEKRLYLGKINPTKLNPNRKWWEVWKPKRVMDHTETWVKEKADPIAFTFNASSQDTLLRNQSTEIRGDN